MLVFIFKIGSYKLAALQDNILGVRHQEEASYKFPEYEIDSNLYSTVKPIDITKKLLLKDTDSIKSSIHLYYKDQDSIGCMTVSSIDGTKVFDDDEVFYYKKNTGIGGVIGYLNCGYDIISLIDIPEFLNLYTASM